MIVANRKPLSEILEMVAGCGRIMIVGCKGCVTVCNVGGLKEVQILASSLKIARKKDGNPIEIDEHVLERQCDPEYLELVKDLGGLYRAALFSGGQHDFLRRRGPPRRVGGTLRRVRHVCHPQVRRAVSRGPVFQKPHERPVRRKFPRFLRNRSGHGLYLGSDRPQEDGTG